MLPCLLYVVTPPCLSPLASNVLCLSLCTSEKGHLPICSIFLVCIGFILLRCGSPVSTRKPMSSCFLSAVHHPRHMDSPPPFGVHPNTFSSLPCLSRAPCPLPVQSIEGGRRLVFVLGPLFVLTWLFVIRSGYFSLTVWNLHTMTRNLQRTRPIVSTWGGTGTTLSSAAAQVELWFLPPVCIARQVNQSQHLEEPSGKSNCVLAFLWLFDFVDLL